MPLPSRPHLLLETSVTYDGFAIDLHRGIAELSNGAEIRHVSSAQAAIVAEADDN